jgi:class 3 adenylate cyclase
MGSEQVVQEVKAILLADVADFSKVKSDAYIPDFIEHVIKPVSLRLQDYTSLSQINTWGDAIFALFDNHIDCCHFALDLRELFRRDFIQKGLPYQLGLRVAIHQGLVSVFNDPIRHLKASLGHEIVLCARIEPVVQPGQILATEQIKVACESEEMRDIIFDDIGTIELAKNYGPRRLFNMRKAGEPEPKGILVQVDKPPLGIRDYFDNMRITRIEVVYKDLVERIEDEGTRQQLLELYQLIVR